MNNCNLAWCSILLTVALLTGLEGKSQTNGTTTMDVAMPAGSNFAVASFRFWIPPEIAKVRGVVTLTPGSNGDGRPQATDPFWQEFARKHQFALAGCYFKDNPHDNMNIEEYALASAGSGQTLLDAIAKFATDAKHPEAAHAPLLLWGHSAGGEFNYEFVCWKPERVLAFVVNKGGYYYTHLAPAAARNVPGILFVGEKDEEFRTASVRGLFAVNRRAGALWTFAVEPNAGHEPGRTREMAASFFEAVIQTRLPAGTLNPQSADTGWAGDLKTFEIKPGVSKPNGPMNAWLPDETAAKRWQEFVRGEGRQAPAKSLPR